MFLNGDCVKDRQDYLDIALSLPFLYDVNTAMGIIVKTYLEHVIILSKDNNDKAAIRSHIPEALKKLDGTFTGCINVKADLENGLVFWDEVIIAVNSLKTSGAISNELASQFINANNWLSSRRP
ncbi:hypothetical protein RhiirA5_292009 [Rhizophagus irregularis]|eukprot:XP_025171207.1 hypothetical protein GLOIN_2v1463190 [Rhizophagus irregularis DAOM 181602=DAOM 197198]